MSVPRVLREQAKFYARKGFHIIASERRAGSHWMVNFAEFPEPQILTANIGDPRAMLNNIATYRRLKEKHDGKNARGEGQGQDQKDS